MTRRIDFEIYNPMHVEGLAMLHRALAYGLAVTLFAAVSAVPAFPDDPKPKPPLARPSSKDALTPATMPVLHQLIRLQPGEFKWDAVPWYASIWHACKAAAAEDKPILVFGTGGAGFNDPLGNC
jgi:hypothetical protein